MEVYPFGIKVCVVEPGDFNTGFTASRNISPATLACPDYGKRFKRTLKIIEEAKEKGIGYLVAINDSQEVYGENDLFIQQVGYRKEPTTYILDKEFDYKQVDNFYKIYLALDEKEEASFKNKDQLGSLRFEKEYLMFQPDNKKGGILKMMEILQASLQDVVVFGDDYNDLDMFDKDLWTCVAMGNACDALKEKATYITDNNVDDGIYHICEKMKWF